MTTHILVLNGKPISYPSATRGIEAYLDEIRKSNHADNYDFDTNSVEALKKTLKGDGKINIYDYSNDIEATVIGLYESGFYTDIEQYYNKAMLEKEGNLFILERVKKGIKTYNEEFGGHPHMLLKIGDIIHTEDGRMGRVKETSYIHTMDGRKERLGDGTKDTIVIVWTGTELFDNFYIRCVGDSHFFQKSFDPSIGGAFILPEKEELELRGLEWAQYKIGGAGRSGADYKPLTVWLKTNAWNVSNLTEISLF